MEVNTCEERIPANDLRSSTTSLKLEQTVIPAFASQKAHPNSLQDQRHDTSPNSQPLDLRIAGVAAPSASAPAARYAGQEELEKTKQIVEEFEKPGGQGEALQAELLQRAKEHDNWVRTTNHFEASQLEYTLKALACLADGGMVGTSGLSKRSDAQRSVREYGDRLRLVPRF
ncbi:hypothetical protein ON010_g4204 [Phytophthora cinnamomi]|nr:hypothetical protein ON010_g4204 [Phytophthora cinnamomi]